MNTFENDKDRNNYCKKYIFVIENFCGNRGKHAMVADKYNVKTDEWTLYNSWGENSEPSPTFSSDSAQIKEVLKLRIKFINQLIPNIGERVAFNLDLNNSNIELGFEIP